MLICNGIRVFHFVMIPHIVAPWIFFSWLLINHVNIEAFKFDFHSKFQIIHESFKKTNSLSWINRINYFSNCYCAVRKSQNNNVKFTLYNITSILFICAQLCLSNQKFYWQNSSYFWLISFYFDIIISCIR